MTRGGSYYVLGDDARTPRPATARDWSRGYEGSLDRRLAQDEPQPKPGDGWARVAYTALPGGAYVSTVFLGLDHNFGDRGPSPILFETMTFGVGDEPEQVRYSTWAEAEAGHQAAVARARAALAVH